MNRNRVFLPFTLAIIAAIHSPANACATYSAADMQVLSQIPLMRRKP
jgi:hypothetical protein